MSRLRLVLALLFLFLAYGFVGAIDYLTEVRVSCAQRYPDTYLAPIPDQRCAALLRQQRT